MCLMYPMCIRQDGLGNLLLSGILEKNMKKVFLPDWKGYMELPIRTHRLKTGFIRFPKE